MSPHRTIVIFNDAEELPHRLSSTPSHLLQAQIEPVTAHPLPEIFRHKLVSADDPGFDDSDDMGGPTPPKDKTVPLSHPH